MSVESTYQNPLVRDGQSQATRELPALSPDYVKVDERSRDDLIAFGREFSKLVQYYDDNNHRSGNWGEFFKEGTQSDQPHYALFLAFTWLFRFLQDDLNTLTGRHLDHYYKEILQLKHKPAQADSVHLLLELAKNIDQHLLEKGTLLKAGKDALGNDLFYALDKDIVINKSKVTELRTIFREPQYDADGDLSGFDSYGLYASPVANSTDGQGEDQDTDGLRWKLLGESQAGDTSTMPKASIGFAISSPILLLKEGTRSITVNIIPETTVISNFVPYFLSVILGSNDFEKEEVDLLTTLFADVALPDTVTDDQSAVLQKTRNLLETYLKQQAVLELVEDPDFLDNGVTPENERGQKLKAWASDLGIDLTSQESAGVTSNQSIFSVLLEVMGYYYGASLTDAFVVSLSGKEAWVGPYTISGTYRHSRNIELKIDLGIEDPAILAYDDEKLKDGFSAKHPVLKVLLNTTDSNRHNFLKLIKPVQLSVAVSVSGIKNLILQNDTATLNANKPFLPFGPQPTLNSKFYIGSEEAFQKQLDNFSLHMEWADLPDDFTEHYKVYSLDTDSELSAQLTKLEERIDKLQEALDKDTTIEKTQAITALKGESLTDVKKAEELLAKLEAKQEALLKTLKINKGVFKANMDMLQNGSWKTLSNDPDKDSLALFPQDDGAERTIKVTEGNSKLETFDRPDEVRTVDKLDNSTLNGFIRLALAAPSYSKFKAFGHQRYPQLYTEKIIEKMDPEANADEVELPNEPYTPTVASLSLDYTSSLTIKLTGAQNVQEQVFHIHPFGISEPAKDSQGQSITLLPAYDDEGILLIGLEGLKAPQNLSLLFQLNEKSVDHEFVGKVEVTWSYLKDNVWEEFEKTEILEDSTEVFTQSGIVTFQVPKDITDNNSLLPAGKFWLKAAVKENTLGVADALKIAAQAITASFVDHDNDPEHLASPLAAESIKKLKISDSAIKSITQGHASFGGQLAEPDEAFNTRVSERLRHKRRAISIWDYEQLVLEAYPDVYKVKCLNHYDPDASDCKRQMSPGAVTVIVLSKGEEETDTLKKLAPVTNVITLNSIKSYLEDITPPFISARNKLFIKNPTYTRVQVDCGIHFREGYDARYYQAEAVTDLMKYLSPWAFDSSRHITFERKLYKSLIINYLEELEYVDFVCCFKVFTTSSTDKDPVEVTGEIIEAAGPADILISDDAHEIDIVEGDECDCSEKQEEEETTIVNGIGAMIIETDFIVV